MKSLRRFILLALVATISLLAVLEGLWSYRQGIHEIDEVFDAQLAQYARTLLGLIDHAAGPAGMADLQQRLVTSASSHSGRHHPYEAQSGFQIWREQGAMLGHSASLPRRALIPLQTGFQETEVEGERWRFFTLFDSEHQRWIVAGQSSAVRAELAQRFALHDISSAVALVLALGLAVALIMRLGLAPLDKLARQVEQRDENDLRSLDSAGLPRELLGLATSINRAFERLDKALEREKQFTDDAAHELRTPVAIIQTQLENALAEAGPGASHAIGSALEATRSLAQLISQLLELARLSPEHQRAVYEQIELYSLAAEQIAFNLEAIDHKQLQVALSGDEGGRIAGNRRLLSVLIRNLLDNAIKYTPPGGSIEVQILSVADTTRLIVSDSGPGIPPQERQRALQRFYRLPVQQAEAGVSGCGLGLSLVEMIAQLHGASLSLSDADAGGLRVEVEFYCPASSTSTSGFS